MNILHISQFYSCSEIKTSSELFYICELGKYLYINYNSRLSIKGVILYKDLKESECWDYFRMSLEKGWVIDSGLPNYEIEINIQHPINYYPTSVVNLYMTEGVVEYDSQDAINRNIGEYNYKTPKKTEIRFKEKSDELYFFTIDGNSPDDYIKNSVTLKADATSSKAWLSLIAKVHVDREFTGVPSKLAIEFSSEVINTQLALADFLTLGEKSDALKGWCVYKMSGVSAETIRQVGYEAWWYQGRELGYLSHWYTPKQKLNFILNSMKLKVGDIVVLYERDYTTKQNYIKSIKSCKYAIIRGIDRQGVDLELITKFRTKYGSELHIQNQSHMVRQMYAGDYSYLNWNSTNRKFDFTELGVGYLMHTELFFILPIEEVDDYLVLDISDYNGRTGRYKLHQTDAIYWLLKDYDIQFNEDDFKKKYFANRVTAYDTFMSGRNLPDEWLA